MRTPLLGLAALVLIPHTAWAVDVWTVGPTGTFSTISDAIASAGIGDKILVEAGTYAECLVFADVDLRVLALDGPASTTIRCDNPGSLYAVQVIGPSSVVLDGFTIAHSRGQGGIQSSSSDVQLRSVIMDTMSSTTGAGCVDVTDGDVRLYDVSLARCTGTNGGAVRVIGSGSTLGLVDSTIANATASANGGGVFFNGASMWASDTVVSNAIASNGYGGGLYIAPTSPTAITTLTGVTVSDSEGIYGGGVYAQGTLRVVDSDFFRDHARYAGFGGEGGAVNSQGSLTVLRGEMSDNTADTYGGAISAHGANLVGTTFARNGNGADVTDRGGAVYAFQPNALATHGCTFEDNVASQGGGLYAEVRWTGHDDVFDNNGKAVTQYGGAAFAAGFDAVSSSFTNNNASTWGGAIYSYSGPVNVTGSLFSLNGSTTTSVGGALYLNVGGTFSFQNDVFANNQAGSAGAIFFAPNSTASIHYSRFEGNKANTSDGGAVYHSRSAASASNGLDIQWTFFLDNTAFRDGGAVYGTNGYLALYYSWLTHNIATNGRGGAVYQSGGTYSYQEYNVYCRNTAGTDGGAAFGSAVPSSAELYGVALVGNTANRGGAYFEESHSATAPVNPTAFYYSTALGNTSATAGYGGVVVGPTGRLSAIRGVIQANGTTGFRTLNTSGVALTVSDTDFFGQGTMVGAPVGGSFFTNTDPHQGPNGTDPSKPIPDAQWTDDGNCFDDDLTSRWTWEGPTNGVSVYGAMYTDQDGDGDGIARRDCDSGDGSIHVGGTEIPGNGFDEDCQLGDDQDADGDGYISTALGGADCSESDTSMGPGVADIANNGIDEDCLFGDLTDGDADGDPASTDCADSDPLLNGYQLEIHYDGVDRNCDVADDDDADEDGSASNAFGGLDCNDFDDAFGPDATEFPYDNIDSNCDGASDFDGDLDGYDSSSFGGLDCNDFDSATHPGALEVAYDGFDQNCDGANDYDFDLDGFVATAYNAFAGGSAPGLDDCDDTNEHTFPGAPEISDGLDNTCDGVTNPDPDFDGDGVLDWWEGVFGTGVDDSDSDDDGLSDGVEWGLDEQDPNDADGDEIPDALETDADDDTLPDAFEGLTDHDSDGLEDYRDQDDDGDGIMTVVETDSGGPTAAPDTDGDGTPDWLDEDSDNDGALDIAEGTADPDGDDIGAWRDAGANGAGGDPPGPEHYGFGCGCESAPDPSLASAWVLGLAFLAARRRR